MKRIAANQFETATLSTSWQRWSRRTISLNESRFVDVPNSGHARPMSDARPQWSAGNHTLWIFERRKA